MTRSDYMDKRDATHRAHKPQLELFENREVIALNELLSASRTECAELRALLAKYMAENTKLVADLRRADQKLFAAHGERAKAQRSAAHKHQLFLDACPLSEV